jgi:hypothetical protein
MRVPCGNFRYRGEEPVEDGFGCECMIQLLLKRKVVFEPVLQVIIKGSLPAQNRWQKSKEGEK